MVPNPEDVNIDIHEHTSTSSLINSIKNSLDINEERLLLVPLEQEAMPIPGPPSISVSTPTPAQAAQDAIVSNKKLNFCQIILLPGYLIIITFYIANELGYSSQR